MKMEASRGKSLASTRVEATVRMYVFLVLVACPCIRP